MQSFTQLGRVLRSEGVIQENGTICTRAGALLRASEVFSALQNRAEERVTLAAQRASRAAEASERREVRERELAQRKRLCIAEQKRLRDHAAWMSKRGERQRLLASTRALRRQLRRNYFVGNFNARMETF